jgi:tetratricopeptide (TPR) repeat protein
MIGRQKTRGKERTIMKEARAPFSFFFSKGKRVGPGKASGQRGASAGTGTARAALGVVVLMAGLLALPALAQMWASVSGTVYNTDGKPWADVTVRFQNTDNGAVYKLQTDKNGKYRKIGLVPGTYMVSVHGPNLDLDWAKVALSPSEDKVLDINLKEAMASNPAYEEQKKKEEEQKKKFGMLKAHFDAGVKALQQAEQVHNEILRAPAAQRSALQEQMVSLSQTAVGELQQAQQAASPTDPNLHVILANLAKAYENAGKYDQAVESIQKAIALNPSQPSYYILLGTNLARAGKMTEAEAACTKVAAIEQASTGVCWRNVGIVLINAGNMTAAIDPLEKATQADPKNPDGWYWLGSSLLAGMDYKQVGTKIEYIVRPGTAEAFQKYLALAPNGPYAASAKQALAQLTVIVQGTSTKITNKPRRKE